MISKLTNLDSFDEIDPWFGKGKQVTREKLTYAEREHAPGFVDDKMEFFAFPPPDKYWNPAIIKAIREFDPYFVPLWLEWSFKKPYDDADNYLRVSFGRHVLARQLPDPLNEKIPVQPLMQSCTGQLIHPNQLIEILHDNRPDKHEFNEIDLPGKYLPFGWNVYYGMRKAFQHANKNPSAADKEARLVKIEKDTKLKEFMSEDFEYGRQELSRFVQKIMDDIPEHEALQYFSLKAKGQLPKKETQPYAFLRPSKLEEVLSCQQS